jgi:hypothetical protein
LKIFDAATPSPRQIVIVMSTFVMAYVRIRWTLFPWKETASIRRVRMEMQDMMMTPKREKWEMDQRIQDYSTNGQP